MPFPPILTTLFATTTLLDELARELGRPEMAEGPLSQLAKYWDGAGEARPTAGTFLRDIEHLRRRLDELR